MTSPITLDLLVTSANADARYVEEQTRLLREELEHAGIDTFTVPAAQPPGARGAAEILGLLHLALLPTLGPHFVDLVKTWLANRKDSTVKLKVTDAQKSIEIEFSPEKTSWSEVEALVRQTRDELRR